MFTESEQLSRHPLSFPGAARVRTLRRNSGFTLMELLAVLAILVLLAAMLSPSFRSISGTPPREGRGRRHSRRDGRPPAPGRWKTARPIASPSRPTVPHPPCSQSYLPGRDSPSEWHSAAKSADTSSSTSARASMSARNAPPSSTDGWNTIAILFPDGTCRDDGTGTSNLTVAVSEIFQNGTNPARPNQSGDPGDPGSSRSFPPSNKREANG